MFSTQENILINVTAGPLRDTELQQSSSLQVWNNPVPKLRLFLGSEERSSWVTAVFWFSSQINLNISVGEEQLLVNEIPVELSAVTRFNCLALLCKFPQIHREQNVKPGVGKWSSRYFLLPSSNISAWFSLKLLFTVHQFAANVSLEIPSLLLKCCSCVCCSLYCWAFIRFFFCPL